VLDEAGLPRTSAGFAAVTTGLRVSEADEFDGLDITQHGESGYNFEEELFSRPVFDAGTSYAPERTESLATTAEA